ALTPAAKPRLSRIRSTGSVAQRWARSAPSSWLALSTTWSRRPRRGAASRSEARHGSTTSAESCRTTTASITGPRACSPERDDDGRHRGRHDQQLLEVIPGGHVRALRHPDEVPRLDRVLFVDKGALTVRAVGHTHLVAQGA